MKSPTAILGLSLAAASLAVGQFPATSPEDRTALNEQAGQIFEALKPVVAKAAHGTVEVRVSRKRVGFGTVVGPERVLAKWSDVKPHVKTLSCRTGEGDWLPAEVVGFYRGPDLAVLQVTGLKAMPLSLDEADDLKIGQFLALARPDGEAAAMGVVSVLPRSLRESDRAFLGILMDIDYKGPGVKVRSVEPGTGAKASGLKAGDIITGLPGRAVNGNFELSTALQRLQPGEKIRIKYRRGREEKIAEVKLGGRPAPNRIPFGRMERMNKMGGHRYSTVKDGFQAVIQSDMQLEPEDCGAPVIDLDGRVVGIAVARAGRIKSFIIPARTVKTLLEEEPAQPRPEELAGRAEPVREREGQDPFEIMRRKMEEMRRLMEEIEEMER